MQLYLLCCNRCREQVVPSAHSSSATSPYDEEDHCHSCTANSAAVANLAPGYNCLPLPMIRAASGRSPPYDAARSRFPISDVHWRFPVIA